MIMDWYAEIAPLIFCKEFSIEAFTKALESKKPLIPKRLFQYQRGGEWPIKNLRDGVIFLATPNMFNDPYDCAVKYEPHNHRELLRTAAEFVGASLPEGVLAPHIGNPLLELMTKLAAPDADPSSVKQAIEAVLGHQQKAGELALRSLSDRVRASYRVSCFCERLDSLLMWAHYANYHKGFALEYDFSSVLPESFFSRWLWPVIYQDELYDASEMIPPQPSGEQGANVLFGLASALHKAKDWSYEKEWRLVQPDIEPVSGGIAKNAPKPVALYLGAETKQPESEELIGIANARDIPVFRMSLSRTRYEMVPIPI